jgi:hypothetical protein
MCDVKNETESDLSTIFSDQEDAPEGALSEDPEL